MSETQQQHWQRRGAELLKLRKADLCAMYRRLGGLGGKYPPELWRKDEVVSSIIDIEWSRLPEDQKAPDPPRFSPPCDVCGKGQNATPAHRHGGDHHYTHTHNPDVAWVPDEETEQMEEHGPQPELSGIAKAVSLLPFPIAPPHLPTIERPEEQPPRAEATEPMPEDTPLPIPYAYRLDRPAPHREEGTFTLSWGTWDSPPGPLRTVGHAAIYECARTRIGHSYYGPMTVWVWAIREDEHYSTPPPADAYRLDLGDQTETTPQATKDLVDRVNRERWQTATAVLGIFDGTMPQGE